MNAFDVYQHPSEGYEAVKQGFGWPAFFFNAIWAFVKKMWMLGFAILGVSWLLIFMQSAFAEAGSTAGVLLMQIAQLVVCIAVGVKGNDWRRENLEKRGFKKLAAVRAETPGGAIGEVAKAGGERFAEIA